MRDVMYIIDTSRCVFFGDFLFRLVKKEIRYPYIREYCQIFQVICIQYEISLWKEILITSIYINHVKQSIVSAGGIIRIYKRRAVNILWSESDLAALPFTIQTRPCEENISWRILFEKKKRKDKVYMLRWRWNHEKKRRTWPHVSYNTQARTKRARPPFLFCVFTSKCAQKFLFFPQYNKVQ